MTHSESGARRCLLALLLLVALLSACAKKAPHPRLPESQTQTTLADLREFPQNLEVYAKAVGPDKRLLSEAEQDALYASFVKILFGPWDMSRTSISRREAASVAGRARGYKSNGAPWSQPEWQTMLANAGFGSFPSRSAPGITLRRTDLRELPTHDARYAKPTPDPHLEPFDYFQYSALPPGTPLLIAHTSQDGKWHYVECPIAGGWVDAADIGLVDSEFQSIWRRGKFDALIKDGVILPGTGSRGSDSKAGIGTVLPDAGKSTSGPHVLIPVREKTGKTGIAEVDLPIGSAAPMPVPLTAGKVAAIGNVMMNEPYGWGGMLGHRDCSSMIRDLFAPFGLWLPRNSAAQARRGSVMNIESMSASEKAAAILRNGKPFLSLVGMKGHITLYVGAWKNKPALFHNVWGLRIIKDGDDNERFIIGRAVVTSITPGMELENLYRPRTFVDRLRTITRIGTR